MHRLGILEMETIKLAEMKEKIKKVSNEREKFSKSSSATDISSKDEYPEAVLLIRYLEPSLK